MVPAIPRKKVMTQPSHAGMASARARTARVLRVKKKIEISIKTMPFDSDVEFMVGLVKRTKRGVPRGGRGILPRKRRVLGRFRLSVSKTNHLTCAKRSQRAARRREFV